MNEHAAPSAYPLRVDGELDGQLSRWLWLVKWVLVIPHVIVLVFLWIAFVVVTVVAFFAILFTRRYPRAPFRFDMGGREAVSEATASGVATPKPATGHS
jgi:hypothetical protein